MKIVIIAMALVAVASGMKHFDEKRNEMREKWMSMTEEERQEKMKNFREEHPGKQFGRPHHKNIPEEVRQKMHDKFESMTPEERQQMREKIQQKVRADIAKLPEDVQERINQKFAESHEKFASMTDEERKEEIQKIRSQHHGNIPRGPAHHAKAMPAGDFHKKFENLSPEERQAIREKIRAKVQADIAKLPEEVQQKVHKKFEAMHEKFSSLTAEERKEEIKKIRDEHHTKFQSIPSEKRQEIHEKIQKKIRADIAHLPEELQQKIMNNFESKFEKFSSPKQQDFAAASTNLGKMTDEERQTMREKFSSLTPEQRAEIRRQMNIHPRLPSGQRFSAEREGFQNIRSVLDDVMIRDNFVRKENRRREE